MSDNPDVEQAKANLRKMSAALRQETRDDPCNDGPMMQAGAIDTVLAALAIAERSLQEAQGLARAIRPTVLRASAEGLLRIRVEPDDEAWRERLAGTIQHVAEKADALHRATGVETVTREQVDAARERFLAAAEDDLEAE